MVERVKLNFEERQGLGVIIINESPAWKNLRRGIKAIPSNSIRRTSKQLLREAEAHLRKGKFGRSRGVIEDIGHINTGSAFGKTQPIVDIPRLSERLSAEIKRVKRDLEEHRGRQASD